jgi:hypothetical protein
MKISDDLKLVLPLREDDKGVSVYVYHTPISREVFETNYRILAATKAELAGKGIHYQMDSGPRIASLVLLDETKKESLELNRVDKAGNPDTSRADALIAEIKRLSMVLLPAPDGWDMVPIDTAISTGKIDREEWQEVASGIVFFTCHYSLAKKSERATICHATASLLMGLSTSLQISEFADSLRPLTEEEDSEAKAGSSVPR